MTRLGQVPELAFAEMFKSIRRDIQEIKNPQRVGRDILRPKVIEALDGDGNPTVYDLVSTPEEFSNRAAFELIFTANNQTQPFFSPFVKLSFGSPTIPALPSDVYGFTYPDTQSLDDVGSLRYTGYFGNNIFEDDTLVYAKFYAYATDFGTLTINEIPIEDI